MAKPKARRPKPRPRGPITKHVTVVLAQGTYERLVTIAAVADMPVSSYLRKDIENRFPDHLRL